VFSSLNLDLVELGHFAAHLALIVAVVQGTAPILARLTGQAALRRISVNASFLVFLLTSVGAAFLIYAFVTGDYSVKYVAQHSNDRLPMFYKVSALWGGHEGSLYLWVWVLTFYTSIVAWRGRREYAEHLPVILAVQGWLIVGFFGLILFLSNPFDRLFPIPADGHDLNPLLQDPGMVIHPPMLYFGYVGFSVPFAFAITALLTNWKSELWSGLIRRWTLVAWGFLTAGIMLGGWWAYYELGWGGYWAWDPVENASFMPWLLGTALVHSITVQDRRRMLHAWNIFLVISTFALSLLGTFLVRSGVLSSVHAFAVDPGRGTYILAFMTMVLGVSFGIFMARGRYQQAEEAISSWWSREALFVWNNVIFTVACACVLLGTLAPLVADAFGHKITVGAPYFNLVLVPIFLLALALMGAGPLVPWRKANLARLGQRIAIPAAVGGVAGLALWAVVGTVSWIAPVGVGLVAYVLTTLVLDLTRAVRVHFAQQQNESLARAVSRTVLGNRRHYGGMVVHLGIAIIAVGIVGSGLFRVEKTVTMAPGDVVEVGGERLRFDGVRALPGPNYMAIQARMTLEGSGRAVYPERRRYLKQEQPMSESGIDSTFMRDVYVVLAEEAGAGRWGLQVYVNPMVQFIWTGGIVILSGLLLGLSRKRRPAKSAAQEAA